MRPQGNILWHFLLFGSLQASLTRPRGLLLTAVVVASPIGRGLVAYGKFLFFPLSRTMISRKKPGENRNGAWRTHSTFITTIYLPAGLVPAVINAIQIAELVASIAGIPVAVVIAKSMDTFFNPVDKKCVRSGVAAKVERQDNRAGIERQRSADWRGFTSPGEPERHDRSRTTLVEIVPCLASGTGSAKPVWRGTTGPIARRPHRIVRHPGTWR